MDVLSSQEDRNVYNMGRSRRKMWSTVICIRKPHNFHKAKIGLSDCMVGMDKASIKLKKVEYASSFGHYQVQCLNKELALVFETILFLLLIVFVFSYIS